ncbi:hypothetical protein LPJ61_006456 [Coemansia biformis]|uniref:Uncharacterized protein n=1 Tax=Coemansia biformis TaxID=1286918 RepID=A0A9W7XT20_9FUNG|nr:hypothetical protein LPJ61_006456 [Coemansia biformis]
MCANVSCAWPFDSADMDRCFEHDATVPSIRKLAKKRKALATREERRSKRRQSTAPQPGTVPLQSLCASPAAEARQAPTAFTALSTAGGGGGIGQLSDWLAGLCDGAATPGTLSSGSPAALFGGCLRLPESTGATGSLLLSQGKYQQQREGEAGGGALLPADWLESLLAGGAAPTDSAQAASHPHGLTPSSSGAACTGGPAASAAGNVMDANVADLLAALTSTSASSGTTAARSLAEDAVIPRTSCHPSPTASSTESGGDADSVAAGPHAPLSPDDLELLISGGGASDGAAARRPAQPVCVKTHSTDASYLDSLTMLLSPPHSASPAAADVPAGKPAPLDLLDPRFWSSHSAATHSLSLPAVSSPVNTAMPAAPGGAGAGHHHGSFDFSDLFSSAVTPASSATPAQQPQQPSLAVAAASSAPTAPQKEFAASIMSPLDTNSIIENIFGSQPKQTSDVV